jgi:HK97 family phage major capsid protein
MNIEQLRRDLDAKRAEAHARLTAVAAAAERENRVLTEAERGEVQALVDAGVAIKAQIDRATTDANMLRTIEGLVATVPSAAPALPGRSGFLSLGEQFVRSEAMEFFKKGGHRSSAAWRSPSVELFDRRGRRNFAATLTPFEQYAATLTEDPASGGKLVIPDYRPGILETLYQRRVVADLIAPGTTDSNLISYMKETSFVNAADTVAEGATKPESTLTFDAASDPVRKIAHWLPVSEEMLEDVAQIRSYIDARLRLGVELAEEDQLLNGTTTAPDIIGIRNRTGLAADVVRGATEPVADAIFRQIMAIFGTSFLMPDGIVMNPADWQGVQLTKTTTGEYIGGGPFTTPVGPTLWGLPVAVTPAITSGIALVGAFAQAAQVFRKGGIRVEASNSHADFFIKNLVAIRAEERLALAVYRPGAFGEVTGLTPTP